MEDFEKIGVSEAFENFLNLVEDNVIRSPGAQIAAQASVRNHRLRHPDQGHEEVCVGQCCNMMIYLLSQGKVCVSVDVA